MMAFLNGLFVGVLLANGAVWLGQRRGRFQSSTPSRPQAEREEGLARPLYGT